jgi:hypothetical protein
VSYHGVGAGPGPVKVYKVDAPFPWGDNTEIKIPLQAMTDDAWAAISPKIDALETKLIQDMEAEVAYFAPTMVQKIIETNVRPELQKQMEIAFAKVDIAKDDAIKAAMGIAAGLALAIGLGAWWIKKGG